ncbi:MAG: signal peptidase I [Pacificimonas sp.]
MTDTPIDSSAPPVGAARSAPVDRPRPGWIVGLRTILLAVLLAVSVRTFVYEPFSIPSASMNPTLMAGDYLFVAKYPYGYGSASFPWGTFEIDGRVGATPPERGDVIVFTDPRGSDMNFIKRVIGLPGDTVQMQAGTVVLNGETLQRRRISDYTQPIMPGRPCDGGRVLGQDCVYPRYRQELGDVGIDILSRGDREPLDETQLFTVPYGHVFVMGDNRDNSEDSRVSPEDGGFGMVPLTNIVGRADVVFMSVDGTGDWGTPSSLFDALRLDRIGRLP